jgi:hypothetical protein
MKKKAVEKVELNFSNKTFYSILAVIVLIIAGVGVYAFGTTNPSVLGHTLGEIRPPCSGILTSTGSDNTWNCINTPVTCTGNGKYLQYSSTTKTWSCQTYTAPADTTPYACYWSGWKDLSTGNCVYTTQIYSCQGTTYPPITTTQDYCVDGQITQSRTVWICPAPDTGECMVLATQ